MRERGGGGGRVSESERGHVSMCAHENLSMCVCV